MFTGIITDLGRVRRLRHGAGPAAGLELTIATAFETDEIPLGASIACSGPCLTVVAVEPGAFTVQASAETLACSTMGEWVEGTPVRRSDGGKVGAIAKERGVPLNYSAADLDADNATLDKILGRS